MSLRATAKARAKAQAAIRLNANERLVARPKQMSHTMRLGRSDPPPPLYHTRCPPSPAAVGTGPQACATHWAAGASQPAASGGWGRQALGDSGRRAARRPVAECQAVSDVRPAVADGGRRWPHVAYCLERAVPLVA